MQKFDINAICRHTYRHFYMNERREYNKYIGDDCVKQTNTQNNAQCEFYLFISVEFVLAAQ